MSFHWCDNIHTTVFTPRDYQIELLASAVERNTIICLGHKSSKEFIALKLIQELAAQAQSINKICLYLSNNGAASIYTMLQHLTDLSVCKEKDETHILGELQLRPHNVYILKPASCLAALSAQKITLNDVYLMVLEDCHESTQHAYILPIFNKFYNCAEQHKMPKILGLAGPLHSAGCALEELSAMLNALEKRIYCKAETASDIVTVLRYCAKPREYIVQCAPYETDELTAVLRDIINTHKVFLNNHRYDPFEIYNTDEFMEELKDIPDPKKEPMEFLDTILTVLNEMGPWAADRLAVSMFQRMEKQKIKTPHERHFILLCLVNTALLEIHAICEQTFRRFTDHKELVHRYSSPKVLRLLEVLRLFKPEENISKNDGINQMQQDLESVDFHKLTRTLEYSCHTIENISKQPLETRSILDNLDPLIKEPQTKKVEEIKRDYTKNISMPKMNMKTENSNVQTKRQQQTAQGRFKRRPNVRRQMRDNNGDITDTLCSLIFCNHNYTARVLFDLLAEMSRHDPELKFLKCQFTTDRVADPLTEPREAELEHRRQEEVLKRFRMHDCNLLIGTSVLEEGIDVPKCNLVIRWDAPTTYRSYVQCKGRARAAHAYHIILVAPKFDINTYNCGNNERLSERSHTFLCQLPPDMDSTLESDSDSDSDNSKINQYIFGSSKGIVKILNPEVITNKPPTNIELSLQEIKDEELAAIEAAQLSTDTKLPLVNINDIVPALIETATLTEVSVFSLNEIKDEILAIEGTNALTTHECLLNKVINEPTGSVATINELELKEITDEILPIDGPAGADENKADDSAKTEELDEKTNSKTSIYDNFIKVISFDDAIKNLSISDLATNDDGTPTKTSPTKKSKLKSKSKSNGSSPKGKITEKKKFQCMQEACEQNAELTLTEYVRKSTEMEDTTNGIVEQLAAYREIEKMLLQKCANTEPIELEHQIADEFTNCVSAYKPLPDLLTGASVDLSNSIALVNKYCSKLPSDTFTKLTALWRCAKTIRNNVKVFQYTIRLPINSPLKYDIVGLPMATNILARRMAALQACIALHRSGELDDNLQPIGKEGFRAIESDWENFELEEQDEKIVKDNLEPRPGTTKRRQYYYKRIASQFCDCRPTANVPCYLYLLDLTLQCPIPEEQNTRGRKIYPPEDAQQGFGILTLKKIPKLSAFPIFTRSGEVKVSIELSKQLITLTEDQIASINTFLNYTFTNVLRLQKFLMLFDPDSTENCVFIVPTLKTTLGKVIDWDFLHLIEQNATMMPTEVSDELRKTQEFDANKYKDAVVMPWYRNQDQPQYFYVAEICPQLSPLSCFPGDNYNTFKHYYFLKYGLTIQNTSQPLLDVDHTSARLNFLTPRYVNRKGVALPTSSEETKRAKRENLEQKQILVPELCTVHPFPASLWRTAVCLPCILYRVNGLLLADDIRRKVSADIGLGQQDVGDNFEWPMLDFGWSLSEVLRKSRENKKIDDNEDIEADEEHRENEKNGNKENGKCNANWGNNDVLPKSANEIIIEGEKQLQESTFVEIGTWSNDMANEMHFNSNGQSNDDDDDEFNFLPSNVSFCDRQTRYGSPTFWDIKHANKSSATATATATATTTIKTSTTTLPTTTPPTTTATTTNCAASNQYANKMQTTNVTTTYSYYDSDDSFASSYDENNIYSDDDANTDEDDDEVAGRIAFTSKNEAETFETEQEIEKRNKQLSIIQATNANELIYQQTKNLQVGYNFEELKADISEQLQTSITEFKESTQTLKADIRGSGMLVKYDDNLILSKKQIAQTNTRLEAADVATYLKMLPYINVDEIQALISKGTGAISVDDLSQLNADYVKRNADELFLVEGCGDIFDNFNDHDNLRLTKRTITTTTTTKRATASIIAITSPLKCIKLNFCKPQAHIMSNKAVLVMDKSNTSNDDMRKRFSFDYQPQLIGHPGPSPSIILQGLTMSNANDGINLERLETIGDSFLKYAITTYLYITYENVHEGKLSHLRSKQVANLNLYRLGRRKILGEYMIATKFEPHDNWLPPCYYVPKELEKAYIEAKIPPHYWKLVDLPNIKKLSSAEICQLVREKAESLGLISDEYNYGEDDTCLDDSGDGNDFSCFIPYNLVTQHSIPDKSVADCVEALIGAYLIECGARGALIFMAWLGIRVLPYERKQFDVSAPRIPGSTTPDADNMTTIYGDWKPPKSPLLYYSPNAERELDAMLQGFDKFETSLGYKFRDRSYLLQAMTHASYSPNRLTDCYQRLEFLGDAVLDYLITRHLYEDPRQHSPGALTDLRSALVNNTIFASLAVRHGFHKYFRHLSPGLNEVIDRFVRIQNENGHSISEEYYLLSEEECDDAEDVEVPKALGDVFESIAGAIFLDSNMSLDVVWQVYSNMMNPEIEQFSNSVPKSPIRELLELEPETAKFGKPEKLADGRRVRVTVEVFCKGTFRGIGRNYRIAKCTAAKCALRQLKKQGLINKKD